MAEEPEQGSIGARVKGAIRRAGRKQVYVARQLGISGPALSRLLKDGRNLTPAQLQTIAAACGLNLGELIGSPPATAPEILRLFKQLVLLEMPPAVAYDLATGRGGLLSADERLRLNALGERLRAAFREDEEPAEMAALFGERPPSDH